MSGVLGEPMEPPVEVWIRVVDHAVSVEADDAGLDELVPDPGESPVWSEVDDADPVSDGPDGHQTPPLEPEPGDPHPADVPADPGGGDPPADVEFGADLPDWNGAHSGAGADPW